jgi:hypothetical protein
LTLTLTFDGDGDGDGDGGSDVKATVAATNSDYSATFTSP